MNVARARLLAGSIALGACALACAIAVEAQDADPKDPFRYRKDWEGEPGSAGCVKCHEGIEEIHPAEHISCTTCHGGDATAATKEKAHVQPADSAPNDERVLPLDFDLRWQRFENPANL